MIRTQIQLTEDQARRLRQAAQEQGVSLAEIVRRCIERGVEAEIPDRSGRYVRALDLVGSFQDRDGAADVSEEHNTYLEEAYD